MLPRVPSCCCSRPFTVTVSLRNVSFKNIFRSLRSPVEHSVSSDRSLWRRHDKLLLMENPIFTKRRISLFKIIWRIMIYDLRVNPFMIWPMFAYNSRKAVYTIVSGLAKNRLDPCVGFPCIVSDRLWTDLVSAYDKLPLHHKCLMDFSLEDLRPPLLVDVSFAKENGMQFVHLWFRYFAIPHTGEIGSPHTIAEFTEQKKLFSERRLVVIMRLTRKLRPQKEKQFVVDVFNIFHPLADTLHETRRNGALFDRLFRNDQG